MGELALPEGDVVPLLVPEGDDGLLQERQRLVDVRGFLQDSALRLQTKGQFCFRPSGEAAPLRTLQVCGQATASFPEPQDLLSMSRDCIPSWANNTNTHGNTHTNTHECSCKYFCFS